MPVSPLPPQIKVEIVELVLVMFPAVACSAAPQSTLNTGGRGEKVAVVVCSGVWPLVFAVWPVLRFQV